MATSITTISQKIIDGPWRNADQARAACRQGANAWMDFANLLAPPKPILIGRRSFIACCKQATASFIGPLDAAMYLVPIWVGDNPDTEASNRWYAGHARHISEDSKWDVAEVGPHTEDAIYLLTNVVKCHVQIWKVGSVVLGRDYGPGVDLPLRHGEFAVLDRTVIEINSAEIIPCKQLPRPKIVVPPFCRWHEPRVTGLEREVIDEIRRLDITTDETGNLISRPSH